MSELALAQSLRGSIKARAHLPKLLQKCPLLPTRDLTGHSLKGINFVSGHGRLYPQMGQLSAHPVLCRLFILLPGPGLVHPPVAIPGSICPLVRTPRSVRPRAATPGPVLPPVAITGSISPLVTTLGSVSRAPASPALPSPARHLRPLGKPP